ncbi:prolyl aminopeptidase [Atractiella rhizophila]|nr:prolyl aminopeptidase [Atractiella rhizophila]
MAEEIKPTTVAKAPFKGYETAYYVYGELAQRKSLPLIGLHGGPGLVHGYLGNFGALFPDRVIILYDQLGNGNSTLLPKAPSTFWTVELFVEELANLISHLGLNSFDLIGHSWGGMLAAEATIRGALPGLRKLVIYSSLARMRNWDESVLNLLGTMDPELQNIFYEHEKAGTTDSPEYQEAVNTWREKVVVGFTPVPACILDVFAHAEKNPQVLETMYGLSEFECKGTLKSWDISDQLYKINVPTLSLRGQFDEASAECHRPFIENIKNVKHAIIKDAHHVAHLQFPETFAQIVQEFLL